MITVPENIIAVIPQGELFRDQHELIFEPLVGHITRDWFVKHAYFCLPLTIGNQYGFVVKSLYDFSALWNGGNAPGDVMIEFADPEFHEVNRSFQNVGAHFGMGTLTVQNGFMLRTPPGVNLITANPPNAYIDGLTHLTGVVEADNLRRDFTFNLKLTRPGLRVQVKAGDWIGYFLPYPRHFVDHFHLQDGYSLFTREQVEEEQQCSRDFGEERSQRDVALPNGNGRRYWRGEDVYGNRFPDHQKALDKE